MKHPLYNVLCRELRRMTSRRLYFGVCLVLPLFCLFFMATIFGSGQMENIPIGIVDQDNTATSRQIVRNISAVPTFKVTRHFTDETAARQAVQRKEIYGYLSIPTGFTQRATTGMNATLSYYYHYALLSVGSELMAALKRHWHLSPSLPLLWKPSLWESARSKSPHFSYPCNPVCTLFITLTSITPFI